MNASSALREAPLANPLGDEWFGRQMRLVRALSDAPRPAIVVALMLAVVLGLGASSAYLAGSTSWHSTTVLMIDDPYRLATAGDEGPLLKLDQLRIKYADLMGTDVIAAPVARDLHVPVDSVLAEVSAGVPSASLLLDVNADAPDPATARSVSAATAHELIAFVAAEEKQNAIPAEDRFTFGVVDPTSRAVAQGPSPRRAVAIGIGVALVGLVGGFAVTQVVRNRRLLF